MTTTVGKFARLALGLAPVVVAVGGFLAISPWLAHRHPALVQGLALVMALFVMGYCSSRAKRHQRRLDEVQLASQRYANSQGWVWGAGVTIVLFMIPPVMNWLIGRINAMVHATGAPPEMANHVALQLAFFGGITLLMLMQTLGVVVAAAIWWRRVGGWSSVI